MLDPLKLGKLVKRAFAKVILSVISKEIQQVAGTYQLCMEQKGGCEAAVHVMTMFLMTMFLEDDNIEGLFFVDTTNAFNTLNHEAALRNVQSLCSSLANIVLNTYRLPPTLYIVSKASYQQRGQLGVTHLP